MLLFFHGIGDISNIITILEGENSYKYDIYKIFSYYFINCILFKYLYLIVNSSNDFELFFDNNYKIYLSRSYNLFLNYIFYINNNNNNSNGKNVINNESTIYFISNHLLLSLFKNVYIYIFIF